MNPIRLNLGSNDFKLDGWLNVDIIEEFGPDIVEDCVTLPSFKDGSVEEIYSGHLLEHLDDPVQGLSRWLSILKPGGRLTVTVPNLEVAHRLWREGLDFPVLPRGNLTGLLAVCTGFYSITDYRKQLEDNPAKAKAQIHKRVFDKVLLWSLLEMVGFTNIEETNEDKTPPAPKFSEKVIWQIMLTCTRPE